MSFENHILEIQERLKKNEYPNEQAISQGIVLRILSDLDWQVYDPQIVIPQYSIKGRRVDFALCTYKNKPIIFVEVKQPGKTLGADKQLFEYAYHVGVPFAIVTDGKEWHFYLPAEFGSYEERRVYKLDLVERDVQESSYQLDRYLSFKNVANGNALENAREDYKNVSKARQAKANISVAWNKLLDEKDEMLIDVISEKVESLCGFKPTQNQIIEYLSSLQKKVTTPKVPVQGPKPVPPTKPLTKAKIKVTFTDGIEICLPKVAETMVEVIKKIGIEKVRSLNIKMYSFPIVSDQKFGQEKYNWLEAKPGTYILTHSNTDKKMSQLIEINDSLSLGLIIEKV